MGRKGPYLRANGGTSSTEFLALTARKQAGRQADEEGSVFKIAVCMSERKKARRLKRACIYFLEE
jgi:hypothetical protein